MGYPGKSKQPRPAVPRSFNFDPYPFLFSLFFLFLFFGAPGLQVSGAGSGRPVPTLAGECDLARRSTSRSKRASEIDGFT